MVRLQQRGVSIVGCVVCRSQKIREDGEGSEVGVLLGGRVGLEERRYVDSERDS